MSEKIARKIQEALAGSLPGADAQYEMAPGGRKQQVLKSDMSQARKSAVLLLLYPQSQSLFMPLMKRPSYGGVHSGQVSFPGGKAEEHDLTLLDTALRETHEEIGIQPKEIQVLGQLTELFIPPSNFLVSPYIGYIHSIPSFFPDPVEVEMLIEADIREFMQESAMQFRSVESSGGKKWDVPSYHIRGHTIWGATAMILSEFLRLLKEYKLADEINMK